MLNKFHIQVCIYKKVKFTVNRNIINSPNFYLLMFKYPRQDPSVVVPDVLDLEKTEQLPSKSGLIVSRKIVLKEGIKLDLFELKRVDWLSSSGFVVNETLKHVIEIQDCGKGMRFLPIETAQVEFCKRTFRDFNDLIKRPKPRIPGF